MEKGRKGACPLIFRPVYKKHTDAHNILRQYKREVWFRCTSMTNTITGILIQQLL